MFCVAVAGTPVAPQKTTTISGWEMTWPPKYTKFCVCSTLRATRGALLIGGCAEVIRPTRAACDTVGTSATEAKIERGRIQDDARFVTPNLITNLLKRCSDAQMRRDIRWPHLRPP